MEEEEDFFVDAHVSGERTVNTYVYLRKAARLHLDEAKRTPDGQVYRLMSCLVFSAFMVEAFLNHVGPRRVPNWDKQERSLSQAKRLNKVLANVGLQPDLNAPPFSSVRIVFGFRDAMAHGKSATLELRGEVRKMNWSKMDVKEINPLTEWEQLCTVTAVEPLLSHCEEVIALVFRRAGEPGTPFGSFGGGLFHFTRRDI